MTQMIRGVLADQIDDRNARPAGVVQIRQAVGQPWAEMQQSASWFLRHPRIAVGRSTDHSFEQAEYATHFRNAVECGHDVHFGGARICEAGVDAGGDQRAN